MAEVSTSFGSRLGTFLAEHLILPWVVAGLVVGAPTDSRGRVRGPALGVDLPGTRLGPARLVGWFLFTAGVIIVVLGTRERSPLIIAVPSPSYAWRMGSAGGKPVAQVGRTFYVTNTASTSRVVVTAGWWYDAGEESSRGPSGCQVSCRKTPGSSKPEKPHQRWSGGRLTLRPETGRGSARKWY